MTTEILLQIAAVVIGIIFVLSGAVSTYVSYLCIKGKIKPNGAVGVRLNFSRNYKLYQQDKYWYPINRYGGEKTFSIGVLWTLLSLVIIVLPIDPVTKIHALTAVILLAMAEFLISAWQISRYAEKLVAAEAAAG